MFDPALGVRLDENFRTYGGDCRVYDPALADPWANARSAADVFVVCHVLGWVAKAFIVRDWVTLGVLSISWELAEVSLQHVMPNFKECWWDHWLLDVLGCNLLGAAAGMMLCRHFGMRMYNFMGVPPAPNLAQEGGKAAAPRRWLVFSCPRRLGQVRSAVGPCAAAAALSLSAPRDS